MVSYLKQAEMAQLEYDLLTEFKYSYDQIMEINGLSCASAITKKFKIDIIDMKPIIVFCGTSDNGGIGFATARYLKIFGFKNVKIFMPHHMEHFWHLKAQCVGFGVNPLDNFPDAGDKTIGLIVDALLGCNSTIHDKEKNVDTLKYFSDCVTPIAR